MKIIDVHHDFHDDTSGLIIEKHQEIPEEFLSQLKGIKADSGSVREKNFMHVAAVPVAVHELWMKRDGYDCTREPIRETVRRLRKEQLDDFILTNKRI